MEQTNTKSKKVVDVNNLNTVESYRKAAIFFISFTKNAHLLQDEDALSVAMEAIWFSQDNYDNNKGTLFSFIVNNTYSFLRKYKLRHKKRQGISLALQPSKDPLDILIEKDTQRQIGDIIKTLTPLKRRCVELLYYHHLNKSEIARKLGITPEYVRQIFISLKDSFSVLEQKN